MGASNIYPDPTKISEQVFAGLGRVRDLKTGPDGHIYVALELIGKPGRIVRLVPAD